MGTSDPVFRKRIKEHGLDLEDPGDMQKIGELWIDQVWHGEVSFLAIRCPDRRLM